MSHKLASTHLLPTWWAGVCGSCCVINRSTMTPASSDLGRTMWTYSALYGMERNVLHELAGCSWRNTRNTIGKVRGDVATAWPRSSVPLFARGHVMTLLFPRLYNPPFMTLFGVWPFQRCQIDPDRTSVFPTFKALSQIIPTCRCPCAGSAALRSTSRHRTSSTIESSWPVPYW
jgi:hypothetical protein